MTGPTREPFLAIRRKLAERFFERESVIDGLICALLADRAVMLVGPPGTGKSSLARELCRHLEGGRFFEWTVTRATTLDELGEPFLAARVAYLGEVFEARSALVNLLRSTLDRGVGPLLVVGCAEAPSEGAWCSLADRLTLRYGVAPLREEFQFLRLLAEPPEPPSAKLTAASLDGAKAALAQVAIPGAIRRTLFQLRTAARGRGIETSDRRYLMALPLLRVRAFLAGRTRVRHRDIGLMAHVLWNDPSEDAEVEALVRDFAREPESHGDDEGPGQPH